MSGYYTFAAVCGTIIGLCAIAWLVLEAIRLHRVQINRELSEDNKRLREANGKLKDKELGMIAERRVHAETVNLCTLRISQLERENEELKAGTPVCTGFLFVK